ncbi:MAG: sortase [Patescibacteria group bacterium]
MLPSKKVIKIIVTIIAVIVLVYLFFNGKAVYHLAEYSLNSNKVKNQELLSLLDDEEQFSAEEFSEELQQEISDNSLNYPNLGIVAPIAWGISVEESSSKMNYSLVQIRESSRSGEGGAVLISGHSSYYWWQQGDYKEVFANLGKAKAGDKIVVRNDKTYIYQVVNKYEIDKNKPLEIAGKDEPEVLLLMTCTPLGTDLSRLIVEASLISKY